MTQGRHKYFADLIQSVQRKSGAEDQDWGMDGDLMGELQEDLPMARPVSSSDVMNDGSVDRGPVQAVHSDHPARPSVRRPRGNSRMIKSVLHLMGNAHELGDEAFLILFLRMCQEFEKRFDVQDGFTEKVTQIAHQSLDDE